MNLTASKCDADTVRDFVMQSGAVAVGIAEAKPVSEEVTVTYSRWLSEGCHATMDYLDRYHELRADPRTLLEGARSVIVAAFNYYPRKTLPDDSPGFAYYAYGSDYHDIVRSRLSDAAGKIRQAFGGETRVCVDTAPVFEKYWAQQAGVGIRGDNTLLIVPGYGSYIFLGIILSTVSFTPDAPVSGSCGHCGGCAKACPGHAILPDGTIDTRRCLSYLTIENRGPIPDETDMAGYVYGCDICQRVCPHNSSPVPTDIEEFSPSPEFIDFTSAMKSGFTREQFSQAFRRSAVKRTRFEGLTRNLESYLKSESRK